MYIELFGALSLQGVKKFGIEVKIYRVLVEVPKNEVEKTHSLLKTNDLDYVFWVTTVPLSSVKHNLDNKHKARIGRTTQLTKEERSYLALAIYFEEIFKRPYDSEEALFLLEKIGIPLKYVIEKLGKEKDGIIEIEEKKETQVEVTPDKNKIENWINGSQATTETKNSGTDISTDEVSGTTEDNTNQTTYSKAQEINQVISTIITELSNSGKKFSNKETMIKQAKKKLKIKDELSKEEEEQFDAIINEIASKKGLKITPTRIYF